MEQNILGKNIAALRKSKGMTQEALANQLGVTFQAVSKWETGQSCPDITMLPELSDLLGVSIDELFGRAPLVPAVPVVETEQVPREQIIYNQLPWEDDRTTLHAVLFAGHRLIGDSILNRYRKDKQQVEFCYEGPAINIQSDFAVVCHENTVIQGSVTAGDSVECGPVCGNVTAGDGVNCGAVGGSVRAGDGVTCGDVGGDVHASDSVRCHAIYGNVTADDGVHVKYRETPPPADDLGVARTVDYSFGIGSDGIHINGKRLTVDKGFPFNGGVHLKDD